MPKNPPQFPLDPQMLQFLEFILGAISRFVEDIQNIREKFHHNPKEMRKYLEAIRDKHEKSMAQAKCKKRPSREERILAYYEKQIGGGE